MNSEGGDKQSVSGAHRSDVNTRDDKSLTIDFFRSEIDRFVQERGWKPFHTPRELAIALNIEAAELLEIFLFNKSEYPANDKIESLKEEIADVFIYLISLVNSLNMDLTQSVLKKLEKNKKKYPVETFHDGFYEKR